MSGRELPAGSTLLLYTDGLIERRDRLVDDGMTALRDAAEDLHHDGREPDTDSLVARLAPHPTDDLCVLALRLPDHPPTTPPRPPTERAADRHDPSLSAGAATTPGR